MAATVSEIKRTRNGANGGEEMRIKDKKRRSHKTRNPGEMTKKKKRGENRDAA